MLLRILAQPSSAETLTRTGTDTEVLFNDDYNLETIDERALPTKRLSRVKSVPPSGEHALN